MWLSEETVSRGRKNGERPEEALCTQSEQVASATVLRPVPAWCIRETERNREGVLGGRGKGR